MRYDFSYIDLFPYIFIYGVGIILASYNFKRVNSAYLIYILMLVFSSIRYGIGYDYYAYSNNILFDISDFEYENKESLDILFIKVGKFFNSPVLYFFIYAILTLYPIYYVSKKKSIDPKLSMLIYLLFPSFFVDSMGIIRNSLAFSFILLSYYFLTERKYLKSIIIIIIATQIHMSAYIGFLLFFIKFLPKNKIFYIIAIVVFLFLGEIIAKMNFFLMIPSVANYIEKSNPVGSMKYLILFFALLNFLSWNKMVNINPDLPKIISVGVSFFFLFIIDDTLSFRLSNYFLIFIILLFPYQLKFLKVPYSVGRKILICFFYCIIVFQWYLMISNYQKTGNRMSNIPYQTIFYKTDYSNYIY